MFQVNGYRWKPSKAQKRDYAQKMREQEEKYNFITTSFPIREGCYVKFVRKNNGEIIEGKVVTSSYGLKKGQHTFNINGILVKGRNLYDRLLYHLPGKRSFLDTYMSKISKSYPTKKELIKYFPEYKKHINKIFDEDK